MRIWFDTEFIEDGKTIDLISIGLIREDGARYYAESSEVDWRKADSWIFANVVPHLSNPVTSPRYSRKTIATDLIDFVGASPEFWAYYADYDWVVLCQLFGRMVDLPNDWPMYCLDVKQLAFARGNPRLPPQNDKEHHALADAIWTKKAWELLQ